MDVRLLSRHGGWLGIAGRLVEKHLKRFRFGEFLNVLDLVDFLTFKINLGDFLAGNQLYEL